MSIEPSLTPMQLALMDCEKAIEQGLGSAAYSLRKIRDERLYREGWSTFEDYCQQRWGFTRQHVNNVIAFTELRDELETMVSKPPERERQTRPLRALPAPEQRAAAWNEAVDKADGKQPTARQVETAVRRRVEPVGPKPEPKSEWKPAKPDVGGGVSHPARYSSELLAAFRDLLHEHSFPGARVLDPFAGTGKIHDLHPEYDTIGIELEAEWANLHPRTKVGNALDLPFDPDTFDAIVTSPTYGNRLADSHNASDPERRRSYTHDLGRELSAENSGAMHWRNGTQGSVRYRTFHEKAWDEAVLVLKPGGVFVLNFKDHWRDGALMPVGNWHSWCLGRLGLDYIDSFSISTGSLRQGANGELRSVELVLVYGKPS